MIHACVHTNELGLELLLVSHGRRGLDGDGHLRQARRARSLRDTPANQQQCEYPRALFGSLEWVSCTYIIAKRASIGRAHGSRRTGRQASRWARLWTTSGSRSRSLLDHSLFVSLHLGELLEQTAESAAASDKVGVVGVDVGELDADQVVDHLLGRQLALGENHERLLVDAIIQPLESRQLLYTRARRHSGRVSRPKAACSLARWLVAHREIYAGDDTLQLLVYELGALQAWLFEASDLLASEQLEGRLGHEQRSSCSLTKYKPQGERESELSLASRHIRNVR